MLRLILGRSGAGKTLYAIEKAGECAGPVVLLVPEQFTFEAEKLLLQRLGPQAGLHIEALSFTRLAQRVFREYGGLARRYIDDCGRMIVMRLALRQVGDLLAVYRRQAASPAFIETMVGAAAEYKACGVTPALLGEAAQKLGGGLLYEKISDLSLIMGAYDALLGKSLSDSNDDLARLGDCLLSHRFFAGKTVIVDSFKGFTPQERRVLGLILPQADEVYVTLCTDTIDDAEHGLGLFSPVRHTARQLIAEAEKAGTAVATPVRLGEPQRFQNDALRHLERFVFRGRAEQFAQDAPPIHIVSASNIYDEAQYAAQTIASLVRETGCRYREVVVIAGEPELYRGVIDPVFEKYDIPLFLDFRRGVDTHPLMALALSLFEIVLENFRAGPIFRCLKTGLPGLTTAETALLENYVLMWDIRGFEDWGRQWQSHPAGFGKALTEADAATLKEINGIRERVFMPLAAFKAATEKAQSSGDFCRCLYDRLCADGVDRRLPELCAQLRESGELELADEYLRMWETLMGLLDQLALTLGGFPVTAREFYQLMRLGIAGCDIGHIPASLDQVTFGGAQRIRAGEPRYVFVLGLAEGIFPKNGGAGGIFTQSERRRLAEAGLEIAPDAQEQAAEERFFAYKAFTCASQGVWLCCPRSDPAGRALRPSQYLAAVKAIFPLCGAPDDALENPLDALQNEASAFEALALGFRKGGDLPTALKAYFSARPEYAQRLAALERVARREPFAFRDRQAARSLYGEEIHISPSRLETHRQCRFAYFCRYGLNAAPRRKAELAAPEIGTLIHFVLERLLSKTRAQGLGNVQKPELARMVKELLAEYARDFLGGLDDKPERFRYLFMQLELTVQQLVEHIALELAQSEFVPVDFELTLARGGDVAPLVLPLEDGGRLVIEGKVDRTDIMKKGADTYLRVIDYKTGAKEFNLSDIAHGLNLQMLIYLFTLCENGAARYGAQRLIPAGVLYLPAKRPVVSGGRGLTQQELDAAVGGSLRMNGLVSDAPEVVFGMEKDGAGIFIPVKLRAAARGTGEEQWDGYSSVASLAQLGLIRRSAEKTLRAMAKSLRAGDIAALPVNGSGYDPCRYCDYAAVCGHETGDAVESLKSFTDEQVWEQLDE